MLSDILLSKSIRAQKSPRQPGISISSVYPCPVAIHKAYWGEGSEPATVPQEMVMDDGKWQEEQTVQRLGALGIKVVNRQLEVRIGEAQVVGHIDGVVDLGGERLFEHKAMSWERFSLLKQRGLDAFPGVKAQVQCYLLGLRLLGFDITNAIILAKHKDSCEPYDIVEVFDEVYVGEIVGWLDKVILRGWIPKPSLTRLCSYCGFGCFEQVLDLSWIGQASSPEAVERWKKGKQLQNVGKMLEDEARSYFIGEKDKYGNVLVEGLIGDKDTLIIDGLEVRKIIQHRFDIRRDLVLQHFGAAGLMKVSEERPIVTYRVREV